MSDHLDDWPDDDDCYQCGGEGYYYSCIDECACVDPESGCDVCERRCDVCNPKPKARPEDEGNKMPSPALKPSE